MSINVRPSDVVAEMAENKTTGPMPTPAPVMKPKTSRKRLLLIAIAIAALAGGSYESVYYVNTGRFLVSTDDAYVRADMSVIAAKVSGYVENVLVRDNTAVKAGDVLVRIDGGDYQNALDMALAKQDTQKATIARIGDQMVMQQATIEQAKATMGSVKADMVRTQADFDRANTLANSNFGSQQRLDLTRSDRDKATAAIASTTASIDAAESSLKVFEAQRREAERQLVEIGTTVDKAKRDLAFTEIKAPFDGVVGNRAAQPGQYVQPGTRLLALVPLGSVYIDANLKETQLGKIRVGQKADIAIDAQGGRHVEGMVESFSPATGSMFSLLPPENATGNFTKVVQRVPVRIRLPADVIAEGRLRPGLSVVVDIDTRGGDQSKSGTATASE